MLFKYYIGNILLHRMTMVRFQYNAVQVLYWKHTITICTKNPYIHGALPIQCLFQEPAATTNKPALLTGRGTGISS
jgi:hypothetical protein